MDTINLEVWDATGNKRLQVEVPGDVAVERILLVLAEKLHLPRHSPDGELMSYKFHHRRLGVQLDDDRTLSEQGVTVGDIVRIQPEITAGGARG
ncbi:EsaB/YukD family protein [Haliangium sp.]|uniref:EsaB/YukD family protein n=1 Tax=Haliangium sp. TaxID=2663208 RepID=UPI003D1067B0